MRRFEWKWLGGWLVCALVACGGETGGTDGGDDAGPDAAGSDANVDAGVDTEADAGSDAGADPDAADDAGDDADATGPDTDAADAEADAGDDAAVDTGDVSLDADAAGDADAMAPDASDADAGADASDAETDVAPDADATSDADAASDADTSTDTDAGTFPDDWVPLFTETTPLEPALQEDTGEALITRFADRARDRHAREDEFQAYDHYLPFYWEYRTTTIEIVDTIPHGGDTITFNVTTQWPLREREAELRFFYRGIGTVAEYHNNGVMTALGDNHYTRSVNWNAALGRPLQTGDRMEFELSQFLDAPPRGRVNYYGTTFLYIVGEGIVPWQTRGVFGDGSTEREDSYPIPESHWLGGGTTLPYQYSNEPESHLLQMATNIAPQHGQSFVLGRRVHHTRMDDGTHSESAENGVFDDLVGLAGNHHVNRSCSGCHINNGRGVPPAVGEIPETFVVRVGNADGSPSADYGAVLQPRAIEGTPEGRVRLMRWDESDGLRTPVYTYPDGEPAATSVRNAPPLVGMGLLEAIPEEAILALADPDDADGDGISGRPHVVEDPETGELRIGRFGWTASRATVRHQAASALNTDMGVMTTVFPSPDCGSAQTDCGPSGAELADEHLESLTLYVALLGVRARRGLDDVEAIRGEQLFEDTGCTGCHNPTFETSPYHPNAELRSQTIHPYTDLLLHDMGPGLAATLPDGDILASEWRTPPLWGIGLTAGVSGEEAYLHDGRARTLDEAIRWHGGEAEAVREAYEALTPADREALLAFLRTL